MNVDLQRLSLPPSPPYPFISPLVFRALARHCSRDGGGSRGGGIFFLTKTT